MIQILNLNKEKNTMKIIQIVLFLPNVGHIVEYPKSAFHVVICHQEIKYNKVEIIHS